MKYASIICYIPLPLYENVSNDNIKIEDFLTNGIYKEIKNNKYNKKDVFGTDTPDSKEGFYFQQLPFNNLTSDGGLYRNISKAE